MYMNYMIRYNVDTGETQRKGMADGLNLHLSIKLLHQDLYQLILILSIWCIIYLWLKKSFGKAF